MNREQMVETGVMATFREDRDDEMSLAETLGFSEEYARRVVVPTILDAILPQVTTVEELEALPARAKVADGWGDIWWTPNTGLTWKSLDGSWASPGLLVASGPLTVVWRPEP